jgi:hypothetical protein
VMVTHFTVIGWADHRTKHSFYKLATPEPATALSNGQPDRCELQPATEVSQIPDVGNRAGKSNGTRLP